MQCAQSNDKSGYAGFRSEEVTEGVKMKAWIAIHSRTNAVLDLIGATLVTFDGVASGKELVAVGTVQRSGGS